MVSSKVLVQALPNHTTIRKVVVTGYYQAVSGRNEGEKRELQDRHGVKVTI